jgi:hypothetical protein
MENQILELEQTEIQQNQNGPEIKELFELQLAVIGGGCVEYCPY